jgi:hypothetical protein
MSAEKEAPAALTADAMKQPVMTAPSTAILYCDVYGRIRTEPPMAAEDLVAAVQPADIFAVPQRSKYWRDTLQHGGKPRWQQNGRGSR